ncbi:pyruvate carboxylase [Listeria sp. SHR_NRA_18]|uniref:pyruvate carboxylase n=1 Tax=Listeria sp. SHR_NRA_18 TaxID=2269046 RepID=UPI00051E1120|nr:pyruvate carboxylase [Listeria sp. SHR_NRA_18]KGL37732.1 pyruvate carboxylase [Listeriaceae bacterium FSL A5-0209]RQW66899.1 pyruvate carboxylase [Listeria sp. SHR_NRA_18]
MNNIKKVLVANRGEIAIRVLRACTELNIKTVAIYSQEDTAAFHRYKADEAYLVGEGKKPIDAYLDIDNIIEIAKIANVDAIHPGYGFLSENIDFAKRCEKEGIIFVGPKSKHLDMFGDKIKAKEQALLADIPVIPGSNGPVANAEEVAAFGEKHGYPLMVKASLGGGGRGMRVVQGPADVKDAFERAGSEAKAAFGNDEVYVEKCVVNPKHIEVQILGDSHGNIVHLFERDCSVQRRHQKVVEVAPCNAITSDLRQRICDAAVKLMKNVDYLNAGTVEFLVAGEEFYFIEVNPRVQVEHTITEMITGIDIVQSQLFIADGCSMHDQIVGIPQQEEIRINGSAIQCRITTEDPLNNFMPDTGRINTYRSTGGFGVRLDAGNGFQGTIVTPFYDSLLVKLCTWGMTFEQACRKMIRNLIEFRIRGVKTNIPFLLNVVQHPDFISGNYNTSFIDSTPELFDFPKVRDRGTKTLRYISNVTVNGFPGIKHREKLVYDDLRIPKIPFDAKIEPGTKQILDAKGPAGIVEWVKSQNEVLLTDTTLRDAHQSLLATRVRSKDIFQIADPMAHLLPNMFSFEMWGGATFDTAYRFLNEDPWVRLETLRKQIPNVMFQMLLRGANAVGYKNYPDNVIREFVKQSAQSGVDVFRIFDSLNWLKGMEVSIEAVRDAGKVVEAAICYTGDIEDATRTKYNVDYYKDMAKELVAQGTDILAIKDMAGLLKPQAAYRLVSELKDTIDVPIHLHTHDTSGNGIYTYAAAVSAGVDIVDVSSSAMSGATSQPSMTGLYYGLENGKRQTILNAHNSQIINHYWEDVRKYYKDFDNALNSPQTEVYIHEMPGGQYTNLQQQAKAVGLGDRWDEVKDTYAVVNEMFGDIVKVTPSSKVVGDMALFMVQNDLTEQDVYDKGETLDFPDSIIEFFMGEIGQPYGGFPEKLQKLVLKGRTPLTERPGALMEPVDFEAVRAELAGKMTTGEPTDHDVMSYILYPKVFLDYLTMIEKYGDVTVLDTPTFFKGMRLGETVEVELEKGKTLIIKLNSIGEPIADGTRVIYFELNGQPREISVQDFNVQSTVVTRRKIDTTNPEHVGATMTGSVIKIVAEKGQEVKKGDPLLITEAMKMETTIQAPFDGKVNAIFVTDGDVIESADLLMEVGRV